MKKSVKKPFAKLVAVSHSPQKELPGPVRQANHIRLADFIQENTKHIVSEWEAFARTLTPACNDMTPLALRDHIHELLAFIVSDIRSLQTAAEQIKKSHGDKKKKSVPTAAQTHAALRLAGGFDIDQMISEYRALRASVVKLWNKANGHMSEIDVIDLTRFNESIDQELAESVSHYTHKVAHSKDLFIGILSHDLRSPLNVISMSAQLLLNIGLPSNAPLDERQTMLTNQIVESTSRITGIVTDLLDVTRARFGAGLPVVRAPMDMGFVSRQLVDEMRAAHPTRIITLDVSGEMKGEWDKARIGQVFSNLIGNAIQYGFTDSPIRVSVKGSAKEVVIHVHNEGVPIPSDKIATLFDALMRGNEGDEAHPESVNLGLGLFITKDIVVSHGGTIELTSSEEDGTRLTAHFPRLAA